MAKSYIHELGDRLSNGFTADNLPKHIKEIAPIMYNDGSNNFNSIQGALNGKAESSHTHGNIQNGGTLQTNDITIANGDKLVVTDSSDSSKVARASIAFDGSTTTQALTKAGTWATFNNYSHPAGSAPSKTGVPTANATPGFGGTFKVNQITTDATSHVSAVTERTITIPNATATTSADGLMSAADKTKLDGIAAGAEVNQNAFSNVKVGSTTVAADTKTDTLEIVAGGATTITADSTNDKITISSTDKSVTAAANHYTPSTDSSAEKDASGGTATQLPTSSTGTLVQVVTGVKMDAKGHVTGVVSKGLWSPNTTYSNASLGQGYGTCATEEATAAKMVTLSNYSLTTGGIVAVKFTYGLCASATMNINSRGAKKIFIDGAEVTDTTAKRVLAGDIAYFIYDGTQYHFLGTDNSKAEAGTASPLMDGKASVGNSLKYAREDHIHPTDANKLNADGSNATKDGVTAMMRKVPSGTGSLSDESSYFGDSNSDHAKIVRRPILDIWNYVKDNLGTAGSKDRAVYFDGGVPKECDTVLPCSIIDSGTATGYGVYVGGNSAVGSNTRCYCAFLLTATANPDLVAHTYIGTFTFRHGSILNYELKCLTGTPKYPMRIAVSYNKNSDSTYNLGVYVIPADPTVNTYANYKLTRIASAAFTWACTAITAAECAALDNDGAKTALVPIRLFFDGGDSNVTTTGGSWLPPFDKSTIKKCRGIVDLSVQVDLSVINQTTYVGPLATYTITLVNSAGTDILPESWHQKGLMPRQTKSSTSGGTVDISNTHRFVFPITASCNLFAGYRPKITLPSNYPLDSNARVSITATCIGIVHPYYGEDTSF